METAEPPAAAPGTKQRQQVILSWSGGKDSALTLHALLRSADHEVVALLTNVVVPASDAPDSEWRISSHGVRRSLLQAQVAALPQPLPMFEARVSARPRNGEYEEAVFAALRKALARFPTLAAVAYGDLFLEDIKAWREGMLGRFPDRALAPLFPLWGQETAGLAARCIALGFRARLVCVDTTQLDARFAGREFDGALQAELKLLNVDPCLEKGEAHTFVHDGPIFSRPVHVRVAVGAEGAPAGGHGADGRFVYCDLEEEQERGL